MNRQLRFATVLLCLAMAISGAFASPQEDSLRSTLDGDSNSAERASALLAMAAAHARQQPGESLRQVKTAIEFAQQSKDRPLILKATRMLRDLQREAGAYDEFLQSAIRAIELSERSGDREGMAEDLRCLSSAYERLGAYDKAVDASRQALFILKTTGDSSAIGKGILDLMNALVKAGRFGEVLRHGDEALNYYENKNDSSGEANVWMRQAEALMAQSRHVDALPLLNKAARVFRAERDPAGLSRTLMDLAEANAEMGYWALGRLSLNEAEHLHAKLGTTNSTPMLFALCSRFDESEGRVAEALACQRRYTTLRDSLFNQRMAERMAGLQAFYQNERQSKDYADLLDKNHVNEDRIASAETIGHMWFIALVALLGLTVMGLLLIRNQRRLVRRARLKGQVIQRQSEELRVKHMELERQNLRLAESLMGEEQKDLLLKEIHHRVKNNLQIVNTLLRMQGSYAEKRPLEEVLQDCQGRVRSMALVHEHIYKCGDLSRVNVKAHLMALCTSVLRSYDLHERVQVDMNVGYDKATLDNLIPLSLLLNELITNSAKHAFGTEGDGRISVVLRRMGEQQCELVYNDNGSGLEQERFFHADSFGLELVRTLAEQLNGTIRLLKGEGTTFQMTFVPDERPLRKAS